MPGLEGEAAALVAAGDQAMARGDRHAAIDLIEQAARVDQSTVILLRLASLRRSVGNLPGALEAAAKVAEREPNNLVAILLLASLRDAVGSVHQGGRLYRAAIGALPAGARLPEALRKQVEWAQGRAAAEQAWRESVEAQQFGEALPGLTGASLQRMEDFRANILASFAVPPGTRSEFAIPDLPYVEFFDPADFPGVANVERNTAAILREFLALADAKSAELSSRLAGLEAPVQDDGFAGNWSMIPLIRNGTVVDDYANLCPETMTLCSELELPDIALISPSLYFSVLEPNSRIEPHTGITNGRVIAHFPLIVPDSCGFRVGGQTRQWEPGRAMIFDDMIEHEAWNDSDRLRVVLIADLWRPELSAAERAAVHQLMDRKLAI